MSDVPDPTVVSPADLAATTVTNATVATSEAAGEGAGRYPVVLLTGFEPFEQEAVNPSWEAVRALDGARIDTAIGPVRVLAQQLPCVFGAANQMLGELISTLAPQLVIAVGQAGGRTALSVERVAINVDDGRIADNAGYQPIDVPVVEDGPAAYFSTLPIKAIVRALCAAGIPASVSQTAGTFVCNHVFYGLQHYLALHAPQVRGGFIHIPYLPEQAAHHPGQASLGLDSVVAGLRIAIQTTLALEHDIKESGGALD
jgi:pyroglutamyl-peptidase